MYLACPWQSLTQFPTKTPLKTKARMRVHHHLKNKSSSQPSARPGVGAVLPWGPSNSSGKHSRWPKPTLGVNLMAFKGQRYFVLLLIFCAGIAFRGNQNDVSIVFWFPAYLP